MSATVFDHVSESILAAVRAGATLDEACRSLDLKVRTARDWAYRGRKDPDGRFGVFAQQLDSIRAARRLPAAAVRSSLTRGEWEACVAGAVRAGNVAAMKLWHEAHVGEQPAGDDPVLDFVPRSHGGRGE